MQRIIIPTHYVHRSTPLWTKDRPGLYLAPPSGCRHPAGRLPSSLGDAGAIRYLGYADETSPEPVETLTIEAGQFGVFPPEKWHCIEALSEDTVLMSTFMLIQNSHRG